MPEPPRDLAPVASLAAHRAGTMLSVELSRPRTGTVLCTAVGEIDAQTAPLLDEALREAVRARPTHLVVDLGGVHFLAAAALDVLVRAAGAGADDTAVSLVAAARAVVRPLDVTGVASLFARYPDLGTALRATAPPPAGV